MDAARLRTAFPVLRSTSYLNAGTCGPVPEAAVRAAAEAWRFGAQEGRSGTFYQRLLALREQLRERYAALLSAAPADVALTAGTSDGIGRVIAGLELGRNDEVLTADDEHPGLQGPLLAAREQRGVRVRSVPLAEIAEAVSPATKLIACSHVSWSSGARAPAVLAEIARSVPVLLDGAQGVGAVAVDVATVGCTFYAGSGQKWLCGPVGAGMLWVDPAWRDRVLAPAPSYVNLAEPGRGLDAALAPDARRYDAPSQDLATIAAAVCAHDVLAEAGWPAVHERGVGLAAQLASELRARDIEVVPRDDTTLVAWQAGDDAAAQAARDRLAEAGVLVRDLPGRGRLRASVGGWNDEDDLARLLAAV